MILARAVGSDDVAELAEGFRRMGLPTAAAEYLLEKVPHLTVLLTGIGKEEGRYLKAASPEAYVPGDFQRRPGTALISGRRDQLRRLALEAPDGLQAALMRLLATPAPAPLRLGSTTLELGKRTFLMGVINVTPDSFSDGGKFLSPDAAIAHGRALIEAGADLLDVGGESTRPGARTVSAAEELDRVLPVIRALKPFPLSIDTTKAAVAREAVVAGATLVNDVSALGDPRMPAVLAETGAAVCLMHMQGTPATMQQAPVYDDVVAEVFDYLAAAMAKCGLPRERILIDPGIGFGKSVGHNLTLLRRLSDFRQLGVGIVAGTSRKSSIGKLLGDKPADQRLFGTLGSISAIRADIVRVHDVAEARDALTLADAIRRPADAGRLYGVARAKAEP